jgi:hypothetical protein
MTAFPLPRGWSKLQKEVYRALNRAMVADQGAYNSAPDAPPISKTLWGVIAHNAAYMAAEIAEHVPAAVAARAK